MSEKHEKKTGDTVRILRPPPRVFTDVIGCNVWMGDVDPVELALEEAPSDDPYNSAEVVNFKRHDPSKEF